MSEENPYSAPSITAAPVDTHVAFRPVPATHGLRLANAILDQIIIYMIVFAASSVLFMVGFYSVEADGQADPGFKAIVVNLGLMIAYYTLCEGVFGKTAGKLITGTRVVGEDGRKVPISTAFVRSICRLIPFEAFSFLSSDARGWHDSIAKTWVIKGR